jgi:uncharacterized protein involved in response to NO
MHNADTNPSTTSPPPWTLLSYAFRPFFLLNGLFAMAVMTGWILSLHGVGASGYSPLWHGHEIVIGFGGAAIAGFLLTAVAAWTGRPPIQGALLGWLICTWLAGRLGMAIVASLPFPFVAVLDLSFPVLLCVIVSREVIAGRNWRNYPIAFITLLLALLNLLYHLGSADVVSASVARVALHLTVHLLLTLITIIGGRIIPSFTANWLKVSGESNLPRSGSVMDHIATASTVATGIAASLQPTGMLIGVLAFVAGLAHLVRLARWRGLATIPEPLLLVLHIAYLWLPIGYTLMGFAAFGLIPTTAAMHALAMGGIGGMVLAVMTRVALGHTGRALHAARLTVIAYIVFMVATALRTLAPFGNTVWMLDLAAAGWIITFGLFTVVYWPILTRPRIDES